MKKIDASGAQSAPFAVPEIGSRAFFDARFKMPRAYMDALFKVTLCKHNIFVLYNVFSRILYIANYTYYILIMPVINPLVPTRRQNYVNNYQFFQHLCTVNFHTTMLSLVYLASPRSCLSRKKIQSRLSLIKMILQ